MKSSKDREYIVMPIYRFNGKPTIVPGTNAIDAAKRHFGDSIANIQQGSGSHILVTTLSGNKYNVRRKAEKH